MRPMLQIGSINEHVKTLQTALNVWTKSALPKLKVDGVFGMKTDGKVREYQKSNFLAQDGVVGPKTWESLEPLIKQILGMISPPKDEQEAAEKIVAVAESALSTFGWSGMSKPNPVLPQIAAAVCADPENPYRPRQGGTSLLSIFSIAGAGANYLLRCPTISIDAVSKWQEQSAAATAWRNNNDLPAWCGIFCYYVYRTAGIDLGGWTNHSDNLWKKKKFHSFTNPGQAFRGCIGVIDGIRNGGKNHHFIVTGNQNDTIKSIDGNAFGSVQGDYTQGNKSTIARRSYSYYALKQSEAYFLFPNFSKL